MIYIPCQIHPMYTVRVREDRYSEFVTAIVERQLQDVDAYIQQAVQEGWVRE